MDGTETAGCVINYDLLLIAGDLHRSTRAEGATVNWISRRRIGGEENGRCAYPIHDRQDAIGNRAHGGGFGTEGVKELLLSTATIRSVRFPKVMSRAA